MAGAGSVILGPGGLGNADGNLDWAMSPADDEGFAAVYEEMRAMARRFFRDQPEAQTLQPTALVHEVFLRLAASGTMPTDRAHLANLCARAMRQILVDHARARSARRAREGIRHGKANRPLEREATPEDVVALDDVLRTYERLDGRRAVLVELRVFGGFSLEQCAEILGVARSTVSEDWRVARAWLTQAIA